MQRTQVYLPEDLRKEVDRHRAKTGESLSEYIRKSMEERTKMIKKRDIDLKQLAKRVTSGVKVSGWGDREDILKWQREIRKDRKIL